MSILRYLSITHALTSYYFLMIYTFDSLLLGTSGPSLEPQGAQL